MRAMVKTGMLGAALLLTFVGGTWYGSRRTVSVSREARRILYYVCPMHPRSISYKPGDAPCCGMRLEPVYADSLPRRAANPEVPGAVELGPEQRQLIGVRTAEVSRSLGPQVLHTTGRVAVDETRVYRINAAIEGWIRSTLPNTVGSQVKQDEPLASYYSPEFLTAQQAFLYALDALERFSKGGAHVSDQQVGLIKANIQQAIDTLRNLGMSDFQIEQIRQTRKLTQNITINSPAKGFILARNISPGQKFEKGTELYRIGDLSRVWILADLFENEARLITQGGPAVVKYQGRTWRARMSDVLPQFDPGTRTLKVRFETDNPGYVLRPEMFVDVELQVRLPAAITVPADAVIDSGRRRTVFVEGAGGVFEPRLVETGWRLGGLVQITKGLEPGERIVVSGNFLIDSESRMRLAGGRTGEQRKTGEQAVYRDPVCGMQVAATALKVEVHGIPYYFCSDRCKEAFERDPARYEEKRAALPGAGHRW